MNRSHNFLREETMPRSVRFFETGGPEVLKIVEVPVPEPGPGDVRIRVKATNFLR